jgi:HPt (histidine-containing phosphotransfer) domain-containing protein
MTDYVTKPVDPDILLETMTRLLKRDGRDASSAVVPMAPAGLPRIENAPPISPAPAAEAPATEARAAGPIDVRTLLRRCRGKSDLAERLLKMFAGTADKQLTDLRSALAAGDWEALTRLAHTVKGTGANLAADAVSQIAAELEQLGKASAAAAAETTLARLTREVNECIAGIPAVIAGPLRDKSIVS